MVAKPTTFIKLDRNICNWRWYKDANTMRVFIDLLLNANIADKDFMGVTIHRGEIATSYNTIANRLNLTTQNIRTAISHLKSTGELTCKKYPKFQVISVVNYTLYQQALTGKLTGNFQETNSQLTVNQQANQQASQQQSKNIKNIKNIRSIRKKEINKERKKGGKAAGFSGFTIEGFSDFLNDEREGE